MRRKTREWRQAAALGGSPIWFSAAFTIGNQTYVCTGYGPTTAFWQHDPDADTWTRRAGFPGVARYRAVGFSVNGRGYIGTGVDSGRQLLGDFWRTVPAAPPGGQRSP